MSRRSTSFYYSFLALPAEKRQAIIAAWDFCRAVDDAVDEAEDGEGAVQLAAWREELRRIYEENEAATPQGRALLPAVRRFKLPRLPFDDLIDGVGMDLHQHRYETFDALRDYCLKVASAVGLICVEIFGYRDPRTRDYAVRLGIALQLTNILRDIAPDLERGRVYIPQDELRRFGCGDQDLEARIVTPSLRRLLVFQCERARQYYREAEEALPASDARGLAAARIMAAIYLELLTAIERAGYDVFSRRIRVRRPRQAVVAVLTWLGIAVPLKHA
jgi:phytoene synthase